MKRAFDIVVSGVGLLVLAPVLLFVAALLLVSMGRPVLFRQDRPGLDGELFEIIKFRTMRSGSEPDAERLTRVGLLLRSTSLDELPELWNVLRGDMSLVGPRPLLPEYLPLYSDRQATRHDVRPGLTGLAQVSGRNASTWDERLELDARYVEQCSMALDLRILAETVSAVAGRQGISANGAATMPAFAGKQVDTDQPGEATSVTRHTTQLPHRLEESSPS